MDHVLGGLYISIMHYCGVEVSLYANDFSFENWFQFALGFGFNSGNPERIKKKTSTNYRKKKTNMTSLNHCSSHMFIISSTLEHIFCILVGIPTVLWTQKNTMNQ